LFAESLTSQVNETKDVMFSDTQLAVLKKFVKDMKDTFVD